MANPAFVKVETIGEHMRNTENGINEKAWERAMARLPKLAITTQPVTGWTQTHKLKPNGQAERDRLVRARLHLRRTE